MVLLGEDQITPIQKVLVSLCRAGVETSVKYIIMQHLCNLKARS